MSELALSDIDAEADDWTAGDIESFDVADADEELMCRIIRKLRFVRHDIATTEARFGREADRLDAALDAATGPLLSMAERLDTQLCDWFAHKQRQQIAAGTDPAKVRKSFPLPDGVIKSRKSTTVEFHGDPLDLDAMLRKTTFTFAIDRVAVKERVKSGLLKVQPDGRLVTTDGEILEVSIIDTVGYTVATDAVL